MQVFQVMQKFAKCPVALLLFEEIGMEISVQSRIEKMHVV